MVRDIWKVCKEIKDKNCVFQRTELSLTKRSNEHHYFGNEWKCKYHEVGELDVSCTLVDTKEKEEDILEKMNRYHVKRVDLSNCDISDDFLTKLFEVDTIREIICGNNDHVLRFVKYREKIESIKEIDAGCLEYVLDTFPNLKHLPFVYYENPIKSREDIILRKMVSRAIIPKVENCYSQKELNCMCPYSNCGCIDSFMRVIQDRKILYFLKRKVQER